MYWLIWTPRSIDELNVDAAIRPIPRERIPIIVIDDKAFPYLKLLRAHHYNLRKVDDITDVKMVEAYPIVLCDIRGVGRSLSTKFEGAHVIAEIRKHYPSKVIIAFTGQQYDPSYNAYLQQADFTEKKD